MSKYEQIKEYLDVYIADELIRLKVLGLIDGAICKAEKDIIKEMRERIKQGLE